MARRHYRILFGSTVLYMVLHVFVLPAANTMATSKIPVSDVGVNSQHNRENNPRPGAPDLFLGITMVDDDSEESRSLPTIEPENVTQETSIVILRTLTNSNIQISTQPYTSLKYESLKVTLASLTTTMNNNRSYYSGSTEKPSTIPPITLIRVGTTDTTTTETPTILSETKHTTTTTNIQPQPQTSTITTAAITPLIIPSTTKTMKPFTINSTTKRLPTSTKSTTTVPSTTTISTTIVQCTASQANTTVSLTRPQATMTTHSTATTATTSEASTTAQTSTVSIPHTTISNTTSNVIHSTTTTCSSTLPSTVPVSNTAGTAVLSLKLMSSVPKDKNIAAVMDTVIRQVCSILQNSDIQLTWGLNRTSTNCGSVMRTVT